MDNPVGTVESGTSYLLDELARVRRERGALVTQLRRARASRDRWRAEAWYWKRGYMGDFTHGTPDFIKRDTERRQRCGG